MSIEKILHAKLSIKQTEILNDPVYRRCHICTHIFKGRDRLAVLNARGNNIDYTRKLMDEKLKKYCTSLGI